jgi:putative nucleotide binding protein
MKKDEDYGLVLSAKEGEDKKSARIVGTAYFQLVDFELNLDSDVKSQDKIFIGRGSEIIKQERSQLSYDDLNKDEEFELEKAVHSIVIANEPKYVKFFNEQSKDASQLHLLDGISRKLGSKILTEKELNGDFESFEDIDERIKFIESSKDLIVKRILYEIIELPKIKRGRPAYLFTVVKRSNKKEVPEYDEFVNDDSRFIEMIKEKGLLEKEGKRII